MLDLSEKRSAPRKFTPQKRRTMKNHYSKEEPSKKTQIISFMFVT
jgi:hypothetical protein